MQGARNIIGLLMKESFEPRVCKATIAEVKGVLVICMFLSGQRRLARLMGARAAESFAATPSEQPHPLGKHNQR